MNNRKYEAVIGLEVHVELKTGTKIFCSCSSEFGDQPNTHVCPICLGMPGALPNLSGMAVEFAIRAGLALNCDIQMESHFDRKNYFYPDLPKGYQITQYEHPICLGGFVPIAVNGEEKYVRLERIHLEEDAGKLIHDGDKTFVDHNRSGVPLIEIVSAPDMRSPEEAKAYINSLRRILLYTGVSDCRMNEGSLRVDVNVSLRPIGSKELGVKCELKNLNSVHHIGKALEYEIARQAKILDEGGIISAETRRYDENTGKTERMRKKETVVDYRYFREANIPTVILNEQYLQKIKNNMPQMPDELANELVCAYDLKSDDAFLLTQTVKISEYFLKCVASTDYKKTCANFVIGEILPRIDEADEFPITPDFLAEICTMFGEGLISSSVAKKLIVLSNERKESPLAIAKKEKMLKITDPKILCEYAHDAIEMNEKAVLDYKKGKKTAIKQLLGYVMKITGGAADPVITEQLLEQELDQA